MSISIVFRFSSRSCAFPLMALFAWLVTKASAPRHVHGPIFFPCMFQQHARMCLFPMSFLTSTTPPLVLDLWSDVKDPTGPLHVSSGREYSHPFASDGFLRPSSWFKDPFPLVRERGSVIGQLGNNGNAWVDSCPNHPRAPQHEEHGPRTRTCANLLDVAGACCEAVRDPRREQRSGRRAKRMDLTAEMHVGRWPSTQHTPPNPTPVQKQLCGSTSLDAPEEQEVWTLLRHGNRSSSERTRRRSRNQQDTHAMEVRKKRIHP